MEYISQLCYIVTTPNLRGWKHQIFFPTCQSLASRGCGQPVLWPRLTKKLLFWGCHLMEEEQNKGWWKRTDFQASAQMARHARSHATDQWKHSFLSPPTSMGQGLCTPPLIGRCCQSHGNRSREWTTAHNRTDNMPQRRQPCKPSWLARGFSKSLLACFINQQAYQKRECREDIPSSSSATVGLWREEDIMSEKALSLQSLGDLGKGLKAALISYPAGPVKWGGNRWLSACFLLFLFETLGQDQLSGGLH